MGPDERRDREETKWLKFVEAFVKLDGDKAYVTLKGFERLDDYSCSAPSGQYVHKVWKRGEPYVRPCTSWLLGQYTACADSEYINIVWRTLYITDSLLPEAQPASDALIAELEAAHNAAATMEAR